jgi:hypothetical protein
MLSPTEDQLHWEAVERPGVPPRGILARHLLEDLRNFHQLAPCPRALDLSVARAPRSAGAVFPGRIPSGRHLKMCTIIIERASELNPLPLKILFDGTTRLGVFFVMSISELSFSAPLEARLTRLLGGGVIGGD